jgi:hypothetical protein
MKFSKQRMQIHWKEEMTTKKQRKQYLWKLVEDFKRRTTDRDSAFLRKYEQKFVEITKPVTFFYGGSSLFIGAGGGGQFQELVSIRPLRNFRRTRVYSDVPRVTFFTKILRFSWNRIVGVNPLPRGASVGEFRKTCHPRNVESYEIREMSFQESWTCEDLESWTCEAPKSQTYEDPKPWTCEARSHELVKIWNLVPAKPMR